MPAPTGARRFTLSAPTATAAAPFTLGFAFKQGDIPSGRYIAASLPETQAVVKSRWPDGSVKFAVVSGRASLSGGTSTSVALSATTVAPAGAPLSTADLRATGISASIAASGIGAAGWSGSDWDSPVQTWVQGPWMSSWIYRRPVGSDAHLVAWLEVRLYAGGVVEVLPWVENGFVRVASPTSKAATYSFTLGGTQRFSEAFDLLNHQRTPLVSGATLSHWLGSDPYVTARHDASYLQSTRLVPTYWASVSPSAAAVAAQPATYSPLQRGSFPDVMGSTGYHPSIGLLPEWDVLYLTSTAASLSASIERNAFSAGRYGMHFRDEATQRPLRMSAHPNLVVSGTAGVSSSGSSTTGGYTPSAGGATPPTYASSHSPAFGYLAYLVTGRMYHLETVQFHATLNFLKNSDNQRGYTSGIFRTDAGANTTRGAAWAMRTLAQALCVTPDGDTLQSEFLASFEANVSYLHARYVGQPHNPFGWVTPYQDYTGAGDGKYMGSAWQQDFHTAAIGHALALGLPLSSAGRTRLEGFFAWKARSIIGRLGATGSGDYLYRDAAVYTVAMAPSDAVSWGTGAGPWFASWGATYDAALGAGSARTAGDLRGGYFPDGTSYWGNLQPAIAFAVEHGVTGAQEAYNRMTGAGNWPQLRSSFDQAPVWSVRPAGG